MGVEVSEQGSSWLVRGALTVACVVVLVLTGLLYREIEAPVTVDHPALAPAVVQLEPAAVAPVVMRLGVLEAPDDRGGLGAEYCISGYAGDGAVECNYGPESADLHLAVVGDSKMHQWLPAIERAADEHGWRVTTSLKDNCPLTTAPMEKRGAEYPECAKVNQYRLDTLLDDDTIDVVVTSQLASQAYLPDVSTSAAREVLAADIAQVWSRLDTAGRQVVVVLDNPNAGDLDVLDCVARNLQELGRCAFTADANIDRGGTAVQREALARVDGVEVIDMSDVICPDGICAPVLGDVLVYRQNSHLTGTFARAVAAEFADRLVDVIR